MEENIEILSRQLYGISALVTCLIRTLSDNPSKTLVEESLFGIESHLNLLAAEWEELGHKVNH